MPSQAQKKITVFGTRLRARREQLKMTRADLVHKMGDIVTPSSVDGWESGVSFPYTRRLHALATALNWSVEQLVVNTELNSIILRGGAVTGEIVEKVEVETVHPVIVRMPKDVHAYALSSGTINGKAVRGSLVTFAATVITSDDFDTVYLAWADALVETSERFRVNESKALEYLKSQYPDWTINEEPVRLVAPVLD